VRRAQVLPAARLAVGDDDVQELHAAAFCIILRALRRNVKRVRAARTALPPSLLDAVNAKPGPPFSTE
jgi:hypothetical protein